MKVWKRDIKDVSKNATIKMCQKCDIEGVSKARKARSERCVESATLKVCRKRDHKVVSKARL